VFIGETMIPPLIAAGARYFWLDPKVPKRSSQPEGDSAHVAFAHKSGKTWAADYCRAGPALAPLQYSEALPARKASIVLPDFCRR